MLAGWQRFNPFGLGILFKTNTHGRSRRPTMGLNDNYSFRINGFHCELQIPYILYIQVEIFYL